MAQDQNGELRLPPQNLEAERAVLGAILIEPGAFDTVTTILSTQAFYKDAHNQIFASMLALKDAAEPIDALTLTNQLTKEGLLEKVGGSYYITGLADEIPSAANVEHYAQIVREKHILRQVITAGNDMISAAYQGEEEPAEVLDFAEKKLFELQRNAQLGTDVTINSILKGAFDIIDARQNRKSDQLYSGIVSGFSDLDDMTDGFQPSDLVILAGRPSMGKTALALNIARNAAGKGGRIGIFSMEMSYYQIAMRLLTAEAKVDSHMVRRGTLPARQWSKLSTAVGRLSQLPVFIDDTAGMNILELRSRVRRFKAEHNVDMVIIDYMQLIAGHGRSDNRQQEMSEISRSLKALARELDIAVLALSQLSRAPEQRPGKDKRPIMSDLRESGAIEQDADMILFLYRPYVYSRDEAEKALAELIIGKQRNGPTGMVKLAFNNNYARFDPYAPEEILSQLPAEEAPF